MTSFKISCQFLNQRLPMFLGDTESLVIKEDTKCSLFIKAVNGITIGKLDIQINVGSSIESLPPPETCKSSHFRLRICGSFFSRRVFLTRT